MSTNDGKSSDDLIRETKEELDKSQEPSQDYSLAYKSNITTPAEDERKRNLAEGIISDLANQRNEIDSIKEVLKSISAQYNQLATMVNEQTQAINKLAGVNPIDQQGSQKGLNMENLSALGDVAEKIMGAWKSYKGDNQPVALIDQETINREMQAAFFDNLNTGKSINNFVKDALKRKATKEILKGTMEALGQDEHAPQ